MLGIVSLFEYVLELLYIILINKCYIHEKDDVLF